MVLQLRGRSCCPVVNALIAVIINIERQSNQIYIFLMNLRESIGLLFRRTSLVRLSYCRSEVRVDLLLILSLNFNVSSMILI